MNFFIRLGFFTIGILAAWWIVMMIVSGLIGVAVFVMDVWSEHRERKRKERTK